MPGHYVCSSTATAVFGGFHNRQHAVSKFTKFWSYERLLQRLRGARAGEGGGGGKRSEQRQTHMLWDMRSWWLVPLHHQHHRQHNHHHYHDHHHQQHHYQHKPTKRRPPPRACSRFSAQSIFSSKSCSRRSRSVSCMPSSCAAASHAHHSDVWGEQQQRQHGCERCIHA